MKTSDTEPTNALQKLREHDAALIQIVGAGPLTSRIRKMAAEESESHYGFTIQRSNEQSDTARDLFRPADLGHLFKLMQLIAAELLNDGCLTPDDRRTLKQILSLTSGDAGDSTPQPVRRQR